ncbi:MAG: efflux RND transporter periplasmic adaptor subunit, partial [Myxococcota bacterium]
AGQLLAALDDRELAGRASMSRAAAESARHGVVVAEAALDRARADVALARTVLTREEDLAASGHVTAASLEATTTALRAAEAAEKGAIATLETRRADARRLAEEARLAETLQSYAQITSPQAGLVTKRQVEVGTTVAPGAMLFRVVDAELVCVETRVDVSQMGRVAVGLPAKIRLASGDELTGSVARIAHEADPVTRDQAVRGLFDRPPDPLTLAEEAQVVLRIGLARGLVVPGSAVVQVDGKDTVLVARDGHAVQVPVVVRAMGQGAVVVEGLTEGDQVVLEPQTLRPGQRLRPVLGE